MQRLSLRILAEAGFERLEKVDILWGGLNDPAFVVGAVQIYLRNDVVAFPAHFMFLR
jgi:hypothetical protein